MPGAASNPEPRRAGGSLARLHRLLLTQPPEWLADELLRAAEHDPALAARLHDAVETNDGTAGCTAGGTASPDDPRVVELRPALDDVIGQAALGLDPGRTAAWADEVDAVLGRIEKLVADGLADDARRLLQQALDLLEGALPAVHDEGEGFRLLERVELLHHAACVAARPDRTVLGTYLARHAMASPYLVFERALRTYADVLSYSGRAAFEEAVSERFAALPRLGPEDAPDRRDPARARVASLMEDIASRRGTDEYVDAVAHDLTSPHRFLLAARRLADDGRPGEALDWLARATAAFGHVDHQLDDFAAELLHRLGRHAEAVEVAWRRFVDTPTRATYLRLHEHAEAADEWPRRREAALAVLRAQPAAPAPPADAAFVRRPQLGHSTLVEVLLGEGDVDGAWQAALVGGCSREHWLEVARARAAEHPADAVPVLQREIRTCLRVADRSADLHAARLAAELRGYCERAGQAEEFAGWVRRIRAENARRPALQEELTRAAPPRRTPDD